MVLSYSSLREIQKKELESSSITTLEESFYTQVHELLEKKKDEALRNQNILSIKEFENIKRIALIIQTKREEKIALMAVRGVQETAGLASQEKEMLKNLFAIIQSNRDYIYKIWDQSAAGARDTKIRIIRDIEQYKGLDSKTYGPFKTGEEHELPRQEVDWLIKSRIAEIII